MEDATTIYLRRANATKAAIWKAIEAYNEAVEPLNGDVTRGDHASALHDAWLAFMGLDDDDGIEE